MIEYIKALWPLSLIVAYLLAVWLAKKGKIGEFIMIMIMVGFLVFIIVSSLMGAR